MHANDDAANERVPSIMGQHAIKPVQLVAGKTPRRVIEVDEVNSAQSPVIIRAGGFNLRSL